MTTCNRLATAVALCTLLASPSVHAQAEDQAAARSLFDDGRKLLKAGKYDEACPKLEAAARLYSSPGILLNLGDCYEKSGRTASAWTEFGESAAAADRADRRDQSAEAKRRQAAVEPKLSRLTIQVPHGVPGLVVSRDGTDLADAAWGSAIPVDVGVHTLRARADGRVSWEKSVTVSAPGRTVSVEVPELAAAPAVPVAPVAPVALAAPASPPREAESSTSASPSPLPALETAPAAPRSRTLGFVLIGGGAVVGIGGAVLMIVESSRASSARSSDTPATTRASAEQYDSTKTPWGLGLAGAIVGGVAAAAGVVLVVAHGASTTTTGAGVTRAAPWATAGGGGLEIEHAW